MNDQQLDRNLRSVGKACFVKWYSQFSDFRIKDSDLIGLMVKDEGYTESVCRTRVSKSRTIIREGRAKDALKLIMLSGRLSDNVGNEAGCIYKDLKKNLL